MVICGSDNKRIKVNDPAKSRLLFFRYCIYVYLFIALTLLIPTPTFHAGEKEPFHKSSNRTPLPPGEGDQRGEGMFI